MAQTAAAGTLLVSGPQKGPSWAILGVFAGPAPRAGPAPCPRIHGWFRGVLAGFRLSFRAYPSFPHGSPPLSVFVPYMYRAESVYIPNMARVVIIFCLNSWNSGRTDFHHSEHTVGFARGSHGLKKVEQLVDECLNSLLAGFSIF